MLDLTEVDKKLLAEMQRNAGRSMAELASAVGLSSSACWRRVNRLEEEGFIRGRVALLNPEKLGLAVVVFVNVRLKAHSDDALRDFESTVAALPEVTECYTMTGAMDYLLRIVVPDIQAYEAFFRGHLSRMPAVQEVHSSIAITEIKYSTELPL
jgi:Lrp/AsnC family transcriptional regulator